MSRFASDLRQTARSLRASPGLLAASVVSLGLGFGVNLALFAAVQAVFFYEPSVAEPERVVAVQPGNSNQFSYLNYRDLADRGLFDAVAGSRRVQLNLQTGTEGERVSGLAVTANFFEFVGVPFSVGRPFSVDEARAERQARVVVLSRGFWQRRFGGDPSAVGRAVRINGETFAVVGVLPERYRAVTMLHDPDVYVPISALVLPTITNRNNGNALGVLARLRPGATPDQAQTALKAFGSQLEQAYPAENAGMGQSARVVGLRGGEFAGSGLQFAAPAMLLGLFSQRQSLVDLQVDHVTLVRGQRPKYLFNGQAFVDAAVTGGDGEQLILRRHRSPPVLPQQAEALVPDRPAQIAVHRVDA